MFKFQYLQQTLDFDYMNTLNDTKDNAKSNEIIIYLFLSISFGLCFVLFKMHYKKF